MPSLADRGFTLVEALVAMVLSTLVVILVASVFLVQNDFYADSVARSGLNENVRSAVSLVSSELRAVSFGGIVAAEPDSVVFRVPLAVGGVCAVNGTETFVLFPLGGEAVDPAEVSGYGVRDTDGEWTYTSATWASVYGVSGGAAAQTCALAGADTVGARNDFYRLDGLGASPAIQPGDLVMIYQELVFRLALSTLDSVSTALYRGPAGSPLTEYATGLSMDSAFEYQLVDRTPFIRRVTGGRLDRIAVIRLTALGVAASSRAGADSLSFQLSVTIPLKNAN
ncbi:PilW family protein [Gemmatimonadota bacterium]